MPACESRRRAGAPKETALKIWIDADACPKAVRRIVFRASERLGVPVCLVANQSLLAPHSDLVSVVVVPDGVDAADERIAEEVAAQDLVITADIPLAAKVVDKGAIAINPRGARYTEANVKERLAVRDFMEKLRDQEAVGGGPAAFGVADTRRFAATLDRELTRWRRRQDRRT